MTQAQLAERLSKLFGWEVDRSMLARIEKGDRSVTVDELFLLAAALDTTPLLLMTPEDESELMQPTPWRAMTSSRARAWICDSVRMWEQDAQKYEATTARAWARTRQYQEEIDALLAKIAALYGEERIEDVDPNVELSEKASAGAAVVELQLDLATQRNRWLTHVGPWEWTDPSDDVGLLERHPLFTAQASQTLFGRAPVDEVQARHESTDVAIATGDEASTRVRHLVEDVLNVVDQLARAVEERVAAAARPDRLSPPSRPSGSSPPA
jgi:transcriptional regulator with XRE-family HTH domain